MKKIKNKIIHLPPEPVNTWDGPANNKSDLVFAYIKDVCAESGNYLTDEIFDGLQKRYSNIGWDKDELRRLLQKILFFKSPYVSECWSIKVRW